MTIQDKRPMDPAVLRQKAQKLARERFARNLEYGETVSSEEIQKTHHELQVHQIELEMQNEELRRAQAEIEAERERYLDLYDLAPVGYCTLSAKGIILEANLTASTLLGTTRDILVKQPITRFILKDDQDIYYLHRMKLFEAGNRQECELRLVKPGGALFWAHLMATVTQANDGEPVCRVVISDITERKQVEEALQESEERFRTLLENIDTVAVQGYGPDGTTQYWNKASERLYGYNHQEAVGCNLRDLIIPPEMKDDVTKAMRDMAESGQPIPSGELLLMHKDGSRVPVISSHAIVRVPGREQELFCLDVDISERNQAQLMLEQKNQEMEQFVYSISHDLKSPLITVKTFVAMLRKEMQAVSNPQINKDLRYIDMAAEKMQQLLDALEQYSRIGRKDNPPQILPACQSVEDCLTTLAGILQQHEVRVSVGDLPQQLQGDPLHFGQIWQNLIENAVKYRGDQPQPHVEIGATQQAHEVVFYVRDNGMGIAPEHRERIFNLFSQLAPNNDGSGLGLAMVKKIVSIYQGRIWVESAGKGSGSCFYYTLPGALIKNDKAI